MKIKRPKLFSGLLILKVTITPFFIFGCFVFSSYASKGDIRYFLKGNVLSGQLQHALVTKPERIGLNSIISNSKSTSMADITVSGYVYDETGSPLPGASVSVKGVPRGVNTDEKGFFRLSVIDENSILIVKSIGFKTREIKVSKQTSFKINLNPEASELEQVVVVGYGTQKKVTSTGAVSSIGTKELVQSPVANISNSLVGRLPGLFATQTSGEPGADGSTLRIRGIGTFNGSADPLVLVDGIQVENYNNIDPNEIETLSILKDASATAVYGIRGANGVILINTKRGVSGKPQINYTYNLASNSFTDLRESMNSYEYATSWNKGLELDRNSGQVAAPRWTEAELEKFRTGSDPIFYPNTDWYKLMLRNSSGQSQHNLNIRGGQQKIRYFINAGIFGQEGLFRDFTFVTKTFDANTTYKRYNFRSNFNFDVSKSFKIALDVSSQSENRKGNNQSFGSATDFNTSRTMGDIGKGAPFASPGIVGDQLVNIYSAGQNDPLANFLTQSGFGGIKRIYQNNLNGSIKADYLLDFVTKGLAAHASLAIQTFNVRGVVNTISVPSYLAQRFEDGSVVFKPGNTNPSTFGFSTSDSNRRRRFGTYSIDYTRSFGNHNLTGLVLYDEQKNFNPQNVSFAEIPKGYQSFVGRVTYNYKGKYLADFNGAYNGTENFAPGKRFGFFPAGSVGWIPSEEAFFPKNDIITFLKFRASYGLVGNDLIGGSRFLYQSAPYSSVNNSYSFGTPNASYAQYAGYLEGISGNPDVTWERSKKANLAVETIMFREKFKITAEVFDERRNSILLQPQTILNFSAIRQPAVNIGRMNNRGFETDISFTDHIGKDFDYRISGNYSFARNKVLFRDEVFTVSHRKTTGQRLGQFYGLIADGLFNSWDEVDDPNRPVYENKDQVQPGDIKFRDVDGDGMINQNDQVPLGYANTPEKTYGVSLYGKYKGFDLSVLFQGVGNVSIGYNGNQTSYGWTAATPSGTAKYLLESWTPERYAQGLPINFPRFTSGSNFNPNRTYGTSKYFMGDASYLRIKNLELGYNVNPKLTQKIGLSRLRVYVNANNLYTWSKVFEGVDPENNIQRDNINNEDPYPLVRTLNAGVNVNF